MREFGQYRIEELIGTGGMGEVYRAHDLRRDRDVALKLLPESLSSDPEYQKRFRRESYAVARLREPHVVPIHDYGEVDGRLFIDMRLVDGQSLASVLADGGALDPVRAVRLVEQVAEALDAAHASGLVHRDVKPSNILVTANDFVYVVDFGIAHAVGHTRSRLTMTGATIGTLDYMAPERFENRPIDGRTDVYSLACVLFECLTAAKPYPGDDLPALMYGHLYLPVPRLAEHDPAVPAGLDEVVHRGMSKKPDERFPSAGALAAAARAALAVTPARPVPDSERETAVVPAPRVEHRVPEPVPAFAGGPPPAPPVPPTLAAEPPAGSTGETAAVAVGPPPPQPGAGLWTPPPVVPLPVTAGATPPRPRGRGRTAALVAVLVLLVAGITATVTTLVTGRPAAPDRAGSAAPSVFLGAPADPAVPQRPAPRAVGNSVDVPTVGTTVPVGPTPGYMEIAPDGSYAYIANRAAGIITVFDTVRNVVTGTIPVPDGGPQFVAFSPKGDRAYVSIFNNERTVNEVGVLDTATGTFVARVPTGVRPFALDVLPDGSRVYVPNHDSGSITVIDTATNTVRNTISVAPNPHWVDVSQDGTRLYAANHESNVVSVIDTGNDRVLTTIPVGRSPHSILAHPSLPYLYNVNYDDSTMSITDMTTNTVVQTIPTEAHPQDVSLSADGKHGYLAAVDANAIQVFDTKTFRITASVPVGQSPTSVAVAPGGRQAYVTNLADGTVTVLNIAGSA